MPYKNFKWEIPTREIMNEILTIAKDSDVRYILEVDLEYTDERKRRTERFPLAHGYFQILY